MSEPIKNDRLTGNQGPEHERMHMVLIADAQHSLADIAAGRTPSKPKRPSPSSSSNALERLVNL